MNDEILNIVDDYNVASGEQTRYVDAPRPIVPVRKVMKFTISHERDNSKS